MSETRDIAIDALVRLIAPCTSSKHDGVHSDLSCWVCGGTMVNAEKARWARPKVEEILRRLRTQEGERVDRATMRSRVFIVLGDHFPYVQAKVALECSDRVVDLIFPEEPSP